MSAIQRTTVTIKSGETESEFINTAEFIPAVLLVPAGFTGTTISIQVIDADGTAYDLYDKEGDKIVFTVSTGQATVMDIADLVATSRIKLVAGYQAADTEIVLLTRDFK